MRCCIAARRTVATGPAGARSHAGPYAGAYPMKLILLAAGAVVLGVPAAAQNPMHMDHSDTAAPKTPMIMEGYGGGGFAITTSSPRAQAFFDNGMQLAHAFAHKAATEATEEAARLDPQ